LKRERDIFIQTIIPSKSTAFMLTPALSHLKRRQGGGTVAFCTATCRTQVILSIPVILAFVVNMQGFGGLKHWV